MKKVQMALLSFVLFGAFVSVAQADGFQCSSTDGLINAKVYNHTDPRVGTRKAAVLILSDATELYGERTIAAFKSEAGTLKSYGANYVVDIANSELEAGTLDARILDTALGELDSIELEVFFSYGSPVEAGTQVDGNLILVKKDGKSLRSKLVCTRYLKRT